MGFQTFLAICHTIDLNEVFGLKNVIAIIEGGQAKIAKWFMEVGIKLGTYAMKSSQPRAINCKVVHEMQQNHIIIKNVTLINTRGMDSRA